MKKWVLTLAAFGLLFSPAAEANERLRVNDIHNFISNFNGAINSASFHNGRSHLDTLISNQATFENNVNNFNNSHLVNNHYNYGYYGYRYPYHTVHTNIGFKSYDKWEKIRNLETKKRTVPGYRAALNVDKIIISPTAETAVVDVDFREQSVTYNGYNYNGYNAYNNGYYGYAPHHYNHVNLNTHSKCKLHLAKARDQVFLTRMYCNTNTNLPL